MPLLNLVDIDSVKIGDKLSMSVVVDAKNDAEEWLASNCENIDSESEECLSHYIESSYELSADMCDKLANNVFVAAGFKR